MIIQAMPYPAASGAPAVGYLTAESLGVVTITTATFSDTATLSPALGQMASGSNYLVLWGADVAVDDNTGDAIVRLVKNGSVVVSAIAMNKDTTDVSSMGGFIIEAGGAAPAYSVQVGRTLAATANTVGSNSRLSILKLGPDDYSTTSTARVTTTSGTFQTAATLSFTPATSGDYIYLACGLVDRAGGNVSVQLSDGTNSSIDLGMEISGTAARSSFMVILPVASVSGAQTVTLKYRQFTAASQGVSAVGISEVRIVAIRKDRFANAYVTTLGSDSSGANTTYTTGLSQTFTPAAADHLTIMGGVNFNNSSSQSSFVQYDDGGTIVSENIREGVTGQPTDGGNRPWYSHRIAAYAAVSRTQALQRKSESTNTTAIRRGAAIVTLSLAGM